MSRVQIKDPDEKLDYGINYAGRLPDGESIVDSDWIIPVDLISSGAQIAGLVVSIFLAGGVADIDYVILNRVTTNNGRILEDFLVLQIRNKT